MNRKKIYENKFETIVGWLAPNTSLDEKENGKYI